MDKLNKIRQMYVHTGINTGCITAWYGKCSSSDRMALQRVVRMAQYNTGAKPPAILDLYNRLCQRKGHKLSDFLNN
jgi:hypothetical protein